VSERRAGLEKDKCGSRPSDEMGKAAVAANGEQPEPGSDPAVVVARACRHQESERNTGDLRSGCVTQPDAREGQAGLREESERPIVPLKPGNAGGGKGPWFQSQRKKRRQPGDWREPNTSDQGWEAAGDVACQSEERPRVPVLCLVRQGVSGGCAVARLPVL